MRCKCLSRGTGLAYKTFEEFHRAPLLRGRGRRRQCRTFFYTGYHIRGNSSHICFLSIYVKCRQPFNIMPIIGKLPWRIDTCREEYAIRSTILSYLSYLWSMRLVVLSYDTEKSQRAMLHLFLMKRIRLHGGGTILS